MSVKISKNKEKIKVFDIFNINEVLEIEANPIIINENKTSLYLYQSRNKFWYIYESTTGLIAFSNKKRKACIDFLDSQENIDYINLAVSEKPTLEEVCKNRIEWNDLYNEFVTIFSFNPPIYFWGLDVIRLDSLLKVPQVDGVSTSSFILEHYGKRGVEVVERMLEIGSKI